MSQQRVDLNVGGCRFSTTLSTLRRDPDSMLGRMFSSDNQLSPSMAHSASEPVLVKSPSVDCGGASNDVAQVFIDSDGTHFRFVLNYLRRGTSVHLPADYDILKELLVEANYFQIRGLISLVEEKLQIISVQVPRQHDIRMTYVSCLHDVTVIYLDITGPVWQPAVGEYVQFRPEAIEGYWRSVAIAVASFHYQSSQAEAVCGFMQKTRFLPDDMEVFFLRCISCRASTRVGEVWRYDLDSLCSIRAAMPNVQMQIMGAPAVLNGRVSSDCLSVNWSSSMTIHVSKSALMAVV